MRLHKWPPCIVIAVFAISTIILGSLDTTFLHQYGVGSEGLESIDAAARAPSKGSGSGYPPVFAFWISGTGGECQKILRLLKAVYHPRNRYLLHLDAGSAPFERIKLALSVRSERIYQAFGNVDVVGKAYAVEGMGASAVAATLHGAAVLLKISPDWDWFINLSASDYPVMTPDDLLHAFTSLPRDLNFIDQTSNLGPNEQKRYEDIIVDPNLHLQTNTRIIYGPNNRTMPDAFKIFTGSPQVILSRSFIEHCILGLDNLPRKLLLYFANVINPMESYFHTVICNSEEFRNTTVSSSDLSHLLWDRPPTSDPVHLEQSCNGGTMNKRAAIARRFMEKDQLHQEVDENSQTSSMHGSQKWKDLEEPCSSWNDINFVRPGPSGKKLASLLSERVYTKRNHACL